MGSMRSLLNTYHYYLHHGADPRSKDWLLVSSPWPLLAIIILYLLLLRFGPKFMANRKPFDLKGVMVVYNLLVVVLSVYMFKELVITVWLNPKFNHFCALVDSSDDELSLRLAKVIWWYFFSKPLELLDTVIFVLRKKSRQVTFLHVYHHVSMPLLWWLGVRYAPGGESYFAAAMNSLVHAVMYSYYLLSALGPQVQPYLWWKKYLTTLQLVQFFVVLARVSFTLANGCRYPRGFQTALFFYMLSLIVLFSNFFYRTYHVPGKLQGHPAGTYPVPGKLQGHPAGTPAADQASNGTQSPGLGVHHRQGRPQADLS